MAKETAAPLEQVEDQVRKSYADMNRLYSGCLDAMVASNNALMKGCQDMTSELLNFSQGQLQGGFDVSKRLAASSSFESAAQVQADYVKTSLQAYADEYKKLGTIAETMMKDVLAPLKGQTEALAARMGQPAAA